jgi:hypothetical protein
MGILGYWLTWTYIRFAAFADIKNETVMKIMSYRGEDGQPPPAGVSPQLRMLQMEAELQEQRAENADLRASVRDFLGFRALGFRDLGLQGFWVSGF